MGGSQGGSQDSPGGSKVFLPVSQLQETWNDLLDLRQRHVTTCYDQANHRGVSCPSFPIFTTS
jgi:hypothetical protein